MTKKKKIGNNSDIIELIKNYEKEKGIKVNKWINKYYINKFI